MEKQIIYRIHLQHEDTGTILTSEYSYDEIFSGKAKEELSIHKRYYVIGKSEFTGKFDKENNKIFENDIIEFDPKEWGDDKSNIHIVSWDNENSEWNYGGGTANDMEYRKVIGNKFENHQLFNIKNNVLKCPCCKSTKITDISTYESNGIFGPGHRSWKTSDMRCCDVCGVVFKPVE